jgi:hypothetical protein
MVAVDAKLKSEEVRKIKSKKSSSLFGGHLIIQYK